MSVEVIPVCRCGLTNKDEHKFVHPFKEMTTIKRITEGGKHSFEIDLKAWPTKSEKGKCKVENCNRTFEQHEIFNIQHAWTGDMVSSRYIQLQLPSDTRCKSDDVEAKNHRFKHYISVPVKFLNQLPGDELNVCIYPNIQIIDILHLRGGASVYNGHL